MAVMINEKDLHTIITPVAGGGGVKQDKAHWRGCVLKGMHISLFV